MSANPFANPAEINFRIREATLQDSPALTHLSNQLDSSSTSEQLVERLLALVSSDDDAIFVAELHPKAENGGDVVGYIHVHVQRSVRYEPKAEIQCLIVDEHYRCYGAGRMLMQKAETWSDERQNIRRVILYARGDNARGIRFYKELGYRDETTPYSFQFFQKELYLLDHLH